MSSNVEVIFQDDASHSFSISCCVDSPKFPFLLRRNIFEHRGINPIDQKLKQIAPLKYQCQIRKRHPTATLTINGHNSDKETIEVDHEDSVIDIKFMLGPKINALPEHIQLNLNTSQRLLDHQNIDLVGCLEERVVLMWWLELDNSSPGQTPIYRTTSKLLSYDPEYPTIGHLFRKICKHYNNSNHLGARSWKSGSRGDYHWMSFSMVENRASDFASGLRSLGVLAKSKIGICSANRVEWALADYANNLQSFISVPLYDTLGKSAVEYIINHAEIIAVVCSKETLAEIIKARDSCLTLRYIILMDDEEPDKEFIKSHSKSGFTHTFSEIEQLGKKHKYEDVLPTPEDIALICYTSGTTGNPKGVVLSQTNFMSSINSYYTRLSDMFVSKDRKHRGTHLSYLPLPHMYEKIVIVLALRCGAQVGFWSGKRESILDDIQALKPTFFAGVPRVYQRFQEKILTQVQNSGVIKRKLFETAYNAKKKALSKGEDVKLWDLLIFSKLRNAFGGNIFTGTSGSAPLSSQTKEFLKICLMDRLAEGYALSESCTAGTTTDILDVGLGHVGTPMPGVEIKLVDVPEMNYLSTDKPEPRGEIYLRGPTIFKEYFREPELTNEVLFSDGWFATGDIGKWNTEGRLQIIDRKKNIFKTAQGEYIRPEYIQNVYKQSQFITNIFVDGDSNQASLIAIIVPNFENLEEWAKQNDLSNIASNKEKLINHPKVFDIIRLDLEYLGNKEKLNSFEKVKKFELILEDFTVENGLLTSSLKLKRNVCRKKFEQEIKKLYAQINKSKL